MVNQQEDNSVSWQMLVMLASVGVTTVIGAIWLGAVAKQVDVNTGRLTRIEFLLDEIRQHDANTTAQHKSYEQRLDKLENTK